MKRLAVVGVLLLATSSATAAEDMLDEVVVTARRYIEPQDGVPLSVDVVGEDSIGAGGVAGLQSLAGRVPGLYFESMWGGGNAAPVLRGQSQPSTAGDNVGVFVDGVYQASRTALDVDPLDVERIEVVRGPQSALYGRNTFAGAINYVSKSPWTRSGKGMTADAGTDAAFGVQGWQSLALPAGWRARLAGSFRTLGGIADNAATRGARLGGYDRQSLTAAFSSPEGEVHQFLVRLRYQHRRADLPPTSAMTYADYNCGSRDPVSRAWSYYCGAIPVPRRFDVSPGIPYSHGTVWQAALHWQEDFGGLRLESDTSQYVADSISYRDFDDSSTGETYGVCSSGINCTGPPGLVRLVTRFVQVNQTMRSADSAREFTQEFRLSGQASGSLRWMTGLVAVVSGIASDNAVGAQRGSLAAGEMLTALLPATPTQVGPASRLNLALVDDADRQQIPLAASRQDTTSLSLFAVADYDFMSRGRVHAELRGTRERQQFDSRLANFTPSFGRAIAPMVFQDVNPRVSLDWRPSQESLLYASVAKGSRSGGINSIPGLLPDEQRFQPEYNWTSELGWRSRLTGRGMEVAVTAFYIDWEHTQIPGFSVTPGVANLITRNTAGITTRGLESSLDWRVHPQVDLHASFSLVDPRFRAGSDDPGSRVFCGLTGSTTVSDFCVVGPSRDGSGNLQLVPWVDGNRPNRTPRQTWHVAANLRLRANDSGGVGWARFDLNRQDNVFGSSIEGAYYGARTLLDARIGHDRGYWSVQLWGTNLTNARYVRTIASRGAAFYPSTPRPLDIIAGTGRLVGVSLRYAR